MKLSSVQVLEGVLSASMDALIVLDDRHNIRYWNHAAQELFGYSAQEVVGRRLEMLSPQDRHDETLALKARLSAGLTVGPQKTLRAGKDGRLLPVVMSATPLAVDQAGSMASVVVFREASARIDTEQMQHLTALVNDSDDAIVTTTLSGVIKSWNPGAERLFGWLAEEVIGRPMTVVIPKEREHEETAILARIERGEKVEHFETERVRKDGATVSVSVTISPIRNAEGKVVGASKIARDIGLRIQTERVVQHHVSTDAVTGLMNRRAFNEQLTKGLRSAASDGHRATLLLIGLDRFKLINETMGHQAGDHVLRQVGHRLRQLVREGDAIARLGGDEFAVLLPRAHREAEVLDIAARMNNALAKPFSVEGKVQALSASIGIAQFPSDGQTPSLLMQHADEAMHASKRAGGSRALRLSAKQQAASIDRAQLLTDLHQALPERQLRLVYQPVCSFRNGSTRRVEALVRWVHPARGTISPAVFIPLAEEAGLINSIGDWVFREATKQLSEWRGQLSAELQVSINLSPSQLRAGGYYFRGWIAHLRSLGLPGSAVIFEITEGMMVDQSDATEVLLRQIRSRGAEIAIDDFGTGYSSLSLLSRLDVQFLKIDQSFVRSMIQGERDRALVEAIATMAQKLGLKVVAEGVETLEQAEALRAMGCDFGQGYFFARPVDPGAVSSYFVEGVELR